MVRPQVLCTDWLE